MDKADELVTMNVHLAGVIAFVPEDETLWALMPNAILPTPSRWGKLKNRLEARSPHIPFLLIEKDLINEGKTKDAPIDAYFRPGNGNYVSRIAAETPPTIAAIALIGEQLDFGTQGAKLIQDGEVRRDLPRMSVISPKHQYVSHNYHPKNPNFISGLHYERLSAAFHMNTGCLTVKERYGRPHPKEVSFAFVHNCWGEPKYLSKVWNSEVANEFTWTFQVQPQGGLIIIKSMDWKFEVTNSYALNIPRNRTINIAIMHSEVDVAALFLEDTILTGTKGLPDPDFELFYGISTRPSKFFRWRVPVPRDESAGADEKTCAGTLFEGFR